MLALAHKIQHGIDQGAVSDRTEVARKLELTSAKGMHLAD
jgi:hypothetical protein